MVKRRVAVGSVVTAVEMPTLKTCAFGENKVWFGYFEVGVVLAQMHDKGALSTARGCLLSARTQSGGWSICSARHGDGGVRVNNLFAVSVCMHAQPLSFSASLIPSLPLAPIPFPPFLLLQYYFATLGFIFLFFSFFFQPSLWPSGRERGLQLPHLPDLGGGEECAKSVEG